MDLNEDIKKFVLKLISNITELKAILLNFKEYQFGS